MKLKQLTERVWISPFEQERDRPTLGYIRGDNWSAAIDAGHSEAHVKEFYEAILAEGLPLPTLTLLTHWHWDHTFGMHAVNGLCMANEKTNAYLNDIRERILKNGPEKEFFALHESIRMEYADHQPVIVKPADLVYQGEATLNAGNCTIRLLRTESPHTDDSTLVLVEEEGVLFVGDSCGGAFPTWEKDPELCRKLHQTISGIDFTTCVESHWTPDSKEGILQDIAENMNP